MNVGTFKRQLNVRLSEDNTKFEGVLLSVCTFIILKSATALIR